MTDSRDATFGIMAGTALTGAAGALPRRHRARAGAQGDQRCRSAGSPGPPAIRRSPQYMMDNKTFEQARGRARATSSPSTIATIRRRCRWSRRSSADNLDFGMWGNTPIVRCIAQKQPIQLLTVGEGHFRFVLATRKDSPIRNVADLKGKTVGALLGGDPYNVLSQMLRFELGNRAIRRRYDINVVNTPTQAQAATMPTGMDAAIVIYPAFLKAQQGARHGRHHQLVRLHREPLQGPGGRRRRHPAAVGEEVAVLSRRLLPASLVLDRQPEAHRRAIRSSSPPSSRRSRRRSEALGKMTPGQMSELVDEILGAAAGDLGAKVVEDEVLFSRGWCWPTEGDAGGAARRLEVHGRGQADRPSRSTWDQVKAAFKPGAPLIEKAWEETGKQPPMDVFTAKDTKDLRGLPVWDMDKWSARS